MRSFASRLARAALPAGLLTVLLLLVLLASLQYRWTGELSEAERTRLRAAARASAGAFAREFDRELTRAFVQLRIDSDAEGRLDAGSFAERYQAFRRDAAHASLVKEVFLAERAANGSLLLSQFEPSGRFMRAEWPVELLTVRVHIEEFLALAGDRLEELARGHRPQEMRLPGLDVIAADVPALVSPVLQLPWFEARTGLGRPPRIETLMPRAFLVLRLDLSYLRNRLLPALAGRHFAAQGLEYDLAVVRQQSPSSTVWRSNAQVELRLPGDADARLLELRFEDLAREEPRGPLGSLVGVGGQAERPIPFVGGFLRRGDAARSAEDLGHWRLIATHRAGSIEGVVLAMRRRNLTVSGAILLLLAASAVLITVSAQRARRLAEDQMDFVAAVSHELRTPVAVISSAAENLADGLVEGPVRVRRYGSLLRDEGRRLRDMVEQVLDFSGSSGRRTRAPLAELELPQIVDDALGACGWALDAAGFAVEKRISPGLPPIRGDAAALGQAVRNLIANAIAHAPDGRWLAIQVGAKADGTELRITVEDRGPGIPADELPRLFQPFFRGRQTIESQVRGFGLGLALVERVASAHGGRVTVSSEQGQGTAFTIHFPAVLRSQRARQPEIDRVPDPAG